MARFIADIKRTHSCGALTAADIGKEVVLFGWVNNRRDHGGAVFIDLRDREGVTQVVFEQDVGPAVHDQAEKIRLEYCVGIRGKVVSRGANVNPKLKTGEIEVHAIELEIFNRSETTPFQIEDKIDTAEEKRLAVPLPRPAPHAAPEDADDPRAREPPDAQLLHRQGLPRARDALHGQVHAGRRPQLPRAEPAQPRQVLRPRREPAALQAALHGRGLRPVLPDRPLLPRRGSPARPPARVHPDRRRDVLRHAGRHLRRDRGDHRHALEGGPRRRDPAPLPADALRRVDGEVRQRQARPPLRDAARRPHRPREEA